MRRLLILAALAALASPASAVTICWLDGGVGSIGGDPANCPAGYVPRERPEGCGTLADGLSDAMVWDSTLGGGAGGPRCLNDTERGDLARAAARARIDAALDAAIAARYPGALLPMVLSVPSPTPAAACGRAWVLVEAATAHAAAMAAIAAADVSALDAITLAVPDHAASVAACLAAGGGQ